MTQTIDSHVHLWHRATDPQPWIDANSMAAIDRDFDAADLATMLTRTSVESAVIVQSSNSLAETARLIDGATHQVVGVVGWLDLTGDVERQLASLTESQRQRLVGVRHLAHIDPDPAWLRRGDVAEGVAALGRTGRSVDLVVRWWQLDQVEALVADHADVRFVIDHLGDPPLGAPEFAQWVDSIRLIAAHDNVVAKLSGVASDPQRARSPIDACRAAVDWALELFGPDRLMYGSDWPVVELGSGAGAWRQVVATLTGDLTELERDAIDGATARRTYALSGR